MAPGNDARAFVTIVGFLDHIGDFLVGLGSDLVDHGIGKRLAQLPGHFGSPGRHRFQHLGTVQELTAHNEPEFVFIHSHKLFITSLFTG